MPESAVPEVVAPLVLYAADQPEYLPVVAAKVANSLYGPGAADDGNNVSLLCYRLTAEERLAIMAGADLYLGLLAFGGPMQPHTLHVGKDAVCAAYGLEPAEHDPESLVVLARTLRAVRDARTADDPPDYALSRVPGATVTPSDAGEGPESPDDLLDAPGGR